MTTHPLVMLVDEDQAHRDELQANLIGWRVPVVAQCGYGIEATAMAEESQPSLILASIEHPVARAIQTIEALRAARPDVPVVAYTSLNDIAIARRAMHAGVSDILSRPLLAAELLSAIREAMKGEEAEAHEEPSLQSAGTVLTVFGPKGGIGKTTISTNLSSAIAQGSGASVLLIDLDIRFGDVAIMMDVEPETTAAEVAGNLASFDRDSFKRVLLNHPSGVSVLPSPKHPNDWRAVSPEEIAALIKFASRFYDYVILDTPGTFNEIVATAIESATQVMAVTSMDMASIKDTCFVLDMFAHENFPLERVLVTANRSNPTHRVPVADVERVLGKSVFWELPYDPAVTECSQAGTPVVVARPKSRAAQSFLQMAGQITGATVQSKSKPSVFDRFVPTRARTAATREPAGAAV